MELIATLGPATATTATKAAMLHAGATSFRINTSHLTPTEVDTQLDELAELFGRRSPPVILDLQGSKWRLGDISPRELHAGETVRLFLAGPWYGSDSVRPGATNGDDDATGLPVPHPDLFAAAAEMGRGAELRLNDARVSLRLTESRAEELFCVVERGGSVSARKGVSLPGSSFRKERLLDKDREILRRTGHRAGVSYAVSYVRDAAELWRLTEALRSEVGVEGGPTESRIIAKVERPEAVADIYGVGALCNELWICRGDLGAEVGLREMARLVHETTAALGELDAPAIMAGQVLEHMSGHPTPTRSELCHLYDLFAAGYAGVVLSDETAVGNYPVESCHAAAMFAPPW